MPWLRLLVVGMVLSLFAGSFRDAALHPTDVASAVGARAVAALHVRAALGDAFGVAARASEQRTATARPSFVEALVATPHAPPRGDIARRETPWLVRRLFAEHAALLC